MNNGDVELEEFAEKGKDYNLSITTCRCMTDCRHILNDINNRWDAVILNAEVKELPNQKPSINGLYQAINDIRGHKIPWFIVTVKEVRNKAQLFGILPSKERPYSVKKEFDILFDAIQIKVSNNPQIVVKEKYPALCEFCPKIEDLLIKLEYADVQTDVTILNECRKILEWIKNNTIITDMYLSEDIIKELVNHYKKNNKRFPYTETYGDLSLNDFSYAIGRSDKVPVYVQRSLFSCVSTANPGSHNTDIDTIIRNCDAPYVTKMLIYELLNILHWCATLDKKTFEL